MAIVGTNIAKARGKKKFVAFLFSQEEALSYS